MKAEATRLLHRAARQSDNIDSKLCIWRAILEIDPKDEKAKKNIEKYFVSSSNGRVSFLTRRGDGLTMRLGAILVAKTLARKFNGSFHFKWGNGFIGDKFHAMEKVDEVFVPDFINEYSVLEDACFGYDQIDEQSEEFIAHRPIDWKFRGWDVSKIFQKGFPLNIRLNQDDNKFLSEQFYRLPFKTEIKNVIMQARKVEFDRDIVGIHVRGGDIIYGNYRLSGKYAKGRCLPIKVVREIIKDNVSLNKKIIIFGQGNELLNSLKSEYGISLARDMYPDNIGSWGVLFDVVLMSKCANVYAAGGSGVTKLAEILGDMNVLTPERIWGRNVYIEKLVNNLAEEICLYDNYQQSFSFFHAYLLRRNTDLSVAKSYLNSAIQLDPSNHLYSLLSFEIALFQNDVESAENIAKNYVGFYSSQQGEYFSTKEFKWQCENLFLIGDLIERNYDNTRFRHTNTLMFIISRGCRSRAVSGDALNQRPNLCRP